MIADELSQDDIDSLLGGLGGDDFGGDLAADDALSALSGDDSGHDFSAPAPSGGGGSSNSSMALPQFEEEDDGDVNQSLEDLLGDVNLKVRIRLGKSEMFVEDVLRLKPGKVVQLDRMSGDPVDLLVDDRVVARGEVLILNDAFCVRVSEIFSIRDKLERQS